MLSHTEQPKHPQWTPHVLSGIQRPLTSCSNCQEPGHSHFLSFPSTSTHSSAEIPFPPRSFPGCLINEARSHSTSSSHSVIIIALDLDCPFAYRSPKSHTVNSGLLGCVMVPTMPQVPGSVGRQLTGNYHWSEMGYEMREAIYAKEIFLEVTQFFAEWLQVFGKCVRLCVRKHKSCKKESKEDVRWISVLRGTKSLPH